MKMKYSTNALTFYKGFNVSAYREGSRKIPYVVTESQEIQDRGMVYAPPPCLVK